MKTPGLERGYILVETIVAMGLLSISMLSMDASIRQAIIVHGQSQDITTARFLLEETVADIEMQKEVAPWDGRGRFPAPYERFQYTWEISEVHIDKPALPPDATEADRQWFDQNFKDALAKVKVVISWTRAGQPFEVVGETILYPDQLWTAPKN